MNDTPAGIGAVRRGVDGNRDLVRGCCRNQSTLPIHLGHSGYAANLSTLARNQGVACNRDNCLRRFGNARDGESLIGSKSYLAGRRADAPIGTADSSGPNSNKGCSGLRLLDGAVRIASSPRSTSQSVVF